MVLDIELFRDDKGGDSKKIKENQAKRYKDVTLVDRVLEADSRWRKCKSENDRWKAGYFVIVDGYIAVYI